MRNGVKLRSTIDNASKNMFKGSGCGSVGRAVASDTKGPWFKSSHQQTFYRTFVYCQLHWKDGNKNRKAENCPFWKYIVLFNVKECSIGKNHIERFVVLVPGVINSLYVSQTLAVIPGTRWSLKKISKNLEVLGWNVLEDNANEASRLRSSVSQMVVQVFLTDSVTSLP